MHHKSHVCMESQFFGALKTECEYKGEKEVDERE